MGSEGKRVEVAERLEKAVDELRTVARKSQPEDYPGNWRLRVGELLAAWDEAVAEGEKEGRPALVGEDAEAPVCGGPTDAFCRPERTDKFDVAPPDAPCSVPPKPEPECCTEEPKVCPLYPDCPEDCVTVFGTRCSLTDQLQRLWRGISGNRTIIDAMSRKLDRLDKGLADLKKLVEEHIAL